MKRVQLAGYQATHFGYSAAGKVATIRLNRPDRKNPLTFDSYGELRDLRKESPGGPFQTALSGKRWLR